MSRHELCSDGSQNERANPEAAHPGGAADAVDIGLRFLRNVEVDHQGDSLHIDARAAMSVATNTRVRPVRKSSSARCRAPWDLFPWMAVALMPSRPKVVREAVGAVLGTGEDQHKSLGMLLGQRVNEQAVLIAALHMADALINMLGGRRYRRHIDAHRIMQEPLSQRADRFRHRRGKQQ